MHVDKGRGLLIDFSKAFDSVDHVILINKLKQLNLPDNIFKSVVLFLTERDQFTKVRDSFTSIIAHSIIQGSGTGPTLFIISIIDLQPIDHSNHMTKYADNRSLLVPERSDVDICFEFQHIFKWDGDNKLSVNMSKTKGIVFHWQSSRNYLPPAEIPGIERVRLLGVWLQSDLGTRAR